MNKIDARRQRLLAIIGGDEATILSANDHVRKRAEELGLGHYKLKGSGLVIPFIGRAAAMKPQSAPRSSGPHALWDRLRTSFRGR